ncbi:class I adenylate cyclase [Halopseudomonas nanhaiensis]|uniref:class I adenylate cyclase n=1 Tax=Halopseudomonas nanhaiensis TaxID=2830842 RepID=UPI001CBD8F30|nr:class I adenylate cyclase [Halopseudomonas nanhaiensis]UAW98537.1 class I adenylate cyclase [Halopseudomonas nanhaiensis]
MQDRGEIRPLISEGIDRKTLATLYRRFMEVNQKRLRRVEQALGPRQHTVLQLIPLLFDVNHPLLPGYVSRQTPFGLPGFTPDSQQLFSAQALSRSFVYRRHPAGFSHQIQALYLMGSGGTIAQSDQSDLDVWVCHAPDLSTPAVAELASKCQLITDWAATQGCEAHFHLVNPASFARGDRHNQLSTEDCGSTQHYLLLDEFYRTAILIGGRFPLWWLVPDYEEPDYADYTRQLIDKRFIRQHESLDLGHVAQIPAGEYVGAGLWQLYKGIDSPYKSVLKLVLTEVYASEHPQAQCLSLDFKRAIYANRLDVDELDPYVMLYRRLERYLLGRGETDRLELIRRCLYIKADVRLSRRTGTLNWKRSLMEKLVREWQWGTRQLQQMDARSEWRVREVAQERRQLVRELTHSYRLLSHFGRSQGVINTITSRDLSLLGRRLYAAFERKAGKVEVVNPGIAPDISEDLLTVALRGDQAQPNWSLYHGTLGVAELADQPPIKRTRHLVELLAWAHRNGIADAATRFAVHPGNSDLTEFELNHLAASLQQMFALPLPALTEAALLRAAQPCQILLLINVGLDPMPGSSQKNLHLISSHTDALGYSGLRDNLIRSIDQIALNSWNELMVTRFEGEDACLLALADYLNKGRENGRLPELSARSFCRNRSAAIAERVEGLFRQAAAQVLNNPPGRFLIQVQNHFNVLEQHADGIEITELPDQDRLMRYLGSARPSYSRLALDSYALPGQDIGSILEHDVPGRIQLFYRLLPGNLAEVSVLDERGAFWRSRQPYRDERTLLLPLLRFLHSIRMRRQAGMTLESSLGEGDVLVYRVQPAGDGRPLQVEPVAVAAQGIEADYFPVQAIAQPGDGQQLSVTIFCDQSEFSQLEYGDQLFAVAARHILGRRRSLEAYPCYITDLDLSMLDQTGNLHTVQYLRYRQQLEDTLNAAVLAQRR